MDPRSSDDSEDDVLPAVLGALFASESDPVVVSAAQAEPTPAQAVSAQTEPADIADIDSPPASANGKKILEWVLVIVCAFAVSLLVRQFLFQAFYIESESMETTLVAHDRVLVNRLSYKWGEPSRGDVIVFARLPEEPGETRDLIKRVIGLPGDEVEGRDNAVYINGVKLVEPYVALENMVFRNFGPVVVPEGELFVMGDNRDNSLDSRRFGTIDAERAAGRAFLKFWPPADVGSL